MSQFYVTFELSAQTESGEVDVPSTEAFIDATLDALLERPELIDPDAGAELAAGRVEFMMIVEARTPERAVATVGLHLRDCVAKALRATKAPVEVGFTSARAEESSVVRAAS